MSENLTSSLFKQFLMNILNIDSGNVMYFQGNWYNPQNEDVNKPNNFVAFRFIKTENINEPFYDDEGSNTNYIKQIKSTEIDLYFIGRNSEEIANSISLWFKREDVQKGLENFNDGKLFSVPLTAWSEDYFLDGLNSILCWRNKIKIAWIYKETTSQEKFTSVIIKE